MLQFPPDAWSRSRIVALSTIVLLFSHPLTFARAFSVEQSQETKADASKPAPNAPEAHKLEVGKPIERELKGGALHTYEIVLEVGQLLNAVVDQRGIDVVVQVIAPDGKPLMEVDSPNGTQGDEPVMLITEVAGVYRLNVASLEKGAPVGKYEIRIKELRAPTEIDRALIEKNRVLREASQLIQEVGQLYGAGKYDAALPLAERVLAISEKTLGAGHPYTAYSLNELALLYYSKGDYAKAEPLFKRALAIYEKALGPDHLDVARVLENYAILLRKTNRESEAAAMETRAKAIRARHQQKNPKN